MNYRPGAIGALTDEYEKALNELKIVFKSISESTFLDIDANKVEDFQSIRNILTHIIRSGYVYSNYARKSFEIEVIPYTFTLDSIEETSSEIDKMFAYHIATFQEKWLMSDDEMMKTIIATSWTTYDLEALLEHAIVHILRHRLQIQKIIN